MTADSAPRALEDIDGAFVIKGRGLVLTSTEPDPPYVAGEVITVAGVRYVIKGIERHPVPGAPHPGRPCGVLIYPEGEERAREYERRISWDTTCGGCADQLDRSYADYEKGRQAGLREGREAADAATEALWTDPDWEGQKPSMGYAASLDQEIYLRFEALGLKPDA